MQRTSLLRIIQIIRTKRSRYDGRGDPSETLVVITRMGTESPKRLVHPTLRCFDNDALRLFDDNAAGESVIELFIEHGGVEHRAVLEDGDGSHMSEALCGGDVVVFHRSLRCSKEIESSNGVAAQSQGKAVH